MDRELQKNVIVASDTELYATCFTETFVNVRKRCVKHWGTISFGHTCQTVFIIQLKIVPFASEMDSKSKQNCSIQLFSSRSQFGFVLLNILGLVLIIILVK